MEGILDIGLVLVAAYQQTDGGIVIRTFYQVVDGVDIVVEFAGILGLEWCGFEFDDYVAAQMDVVEEHVQFAGSSCDDDLFLSAEICETCPEFKEKAGEVLCETCPEFKEKAGEVFF